MAAKNAYVLADPKCLGYEFASEEVLEGATEKLRKESLRALTREEIRIELEKTFAELPPCVQVVFSNQRCQACGQVRMHECVRLVVILITDRRPKTDGGQVSQEQDWRTCREAGAKIF